MKQLTPFITIYGVGNVKSNVSNKRDDMKQLTEDQLRELLNRAFRAGIEAERVVTHEIMIDLAKNGKDFPVKNYHELLQEQQRVSVYAITCGV